MADLPAKQEPEQICFSLATVSEDQRIGVGFIIRSTIQIHDYIGAICFDINSSEVDR